MTTDLIWGDDRIHKEMAIEASARSRINLMTLKHRARMNPPTAATGGFPYFIPSKEPVK